MASFEAQARPKASSFNNGMHILMQNPVKCKSPTDQITGKKSGDKNLVKKRKRKKARDLPKRPLCAYNIFFQYERERILAGETSSTASSAGPPLSFNTRSSFPPPIEFMQFRRAKKKRSDRRVVHGKIGFVELTKTISQRWKRLDASSKAYFQRLAEVEKKLHEQELAMYKYNKAFTAYVKGRKCPPSDEEIKPSWPSPVASDKPTPMLDNHFDLPPPHVNGVRPLLPERALAPTPFCMQQFQLADLSLFHATAMKHGMPATAHHAFDPHQNQYISSDMTPARATNPLCHRDQNFGEMAETKNCLQFDDDMVDLLRLLVDSGTDEDVHNERKSPE